MTTLNISYAQNKEDIILRALLRDTTRGFYVDVGANYPVHESVTKLFYEDGWSGINIEPTNSLYLLLCADRPRDINLKIGISNREDELVFREYIRGNGLSTFSSETQRVYEKSKFYSYYAEEYKEYKVPVLPLSLVLEKYAADKRIDFMKIDVEGYEYEAVEGNDWKKYRPVILCIEANHIVKDWHPILEKAKYHKVFWDGLNEYFVAEEHAALTKDFSYADALFLGPRFTSWEEQVKITRLKRTQRLIEYKLQRALKSSIPSKSPGPILPSSFKGLIKYVVWETIRGFEYYITRPITPKRSTYPSANAANASSSAAITLFRNSLLASIKHSDSWRHRAVVWVYFGLKRRIRLLQKVDVKESNDLR